MCKRLAYLSAPYSKAKDKEALMKDVMKCSGVLMMNDSDLHVVSPLFNHYSLSLIPEMGNDYNFWKEYSINLLRRCDEVIVIQFMGWESSEGVADEIRTARMLGLKVTYILPSDLI